MSKILIWETLSKIGGGQEMSLKVADILKENNELHFLIPTKGELSCELDKRGIDYTLMGDQTMREGRKGFLGLLRFLGLTISAVLKGRAIVRQYCPDIIYAPGPAALVWSAMCARHNTAVVWHLHHMFESSATLKLINIFSAKKCIKKIISVSDCVSKQINNPKALSKKVTLYNFVYPVEQIQPKNLLAEYPKLNKDIKIAQIGFVTPTKNHALSLEVVKNLKVRGYSTALAIIGSVSDDDREYRASLDEFIQANALCDNVVFTGYRSDVSAIIGSFDLVFIPSVEGFSLVAVQAMQRDVPILCIDNTGCSEIVLKADAGMVFSIDSSIDVIADTVIKCLEIDLTKNKKHSEFLSECSYDNFKAEILQIFTL